MLINEIVLNSYFLLIKLNYNEFYILGYICLDIYLSILEYIKYKIEEVNIIYKF